jgi:predicted ABC-type ATPase
MALAECLSGSAARVSLKMLLDAFSITKGFDVLRAAVGQYSTEDEFVAAVSKALVEQWKIKSNDEDAAVSKAFMKSLQNMTTNLEGLFPLPPRIETAFELVLKYHEGWKHDATGRVDNPPSVDDSDDKFSLRHGEMQQVRRVLFAHAPPEMLNIERLASVQNSSCGTSSGADAPCAIITVGAPGAGKSHMLSHCTSFLANEMVLPSSTNGLPSSTSKYARVDPDKHLTHMCNNDNNFRMLANFNTMEDLATAMDQRRHILFDGTGKDIGNTCGRIISRLRAAHYRVFVCIVVASQDACLARIEARRKETGRGVGLDFVQSTIQSLRNTAIPIYISKQTSLAEAVLVYDNEVDGPAAVPRFVVADGSNNASEALEFVSQKLQARSEQESADQISQAPSEKRNSISDWWLRSVGTHLRSMCM